MLHIPSLHSLLSNTSDPNELHIARTYNSTERVFEYHSRKAKTNRLILELKLPKELQPGVGHFMLKL